MKKFRKKNLKNLLIFLYKYFITINIILSFFFKRSKKEKNIHFSGNMQGNLGGTKVKIKRLKEIFKSSYFKFNLVYVLSNAPYLNNLSLKILKYLKIPIVLNQNGLFYPAWYEGDWQSKNLEIANIYLESDIVIFQSEFCKNTAEKFLGKRVGKNYILYNAVDTKKFKPTRVINTKTFNFLITGKIEDHLLYRITEIIKVMPNLCKEMKGVNLNFHGWLSNESYLICKKLIKDLDVTKNVNLNGSYTQEEAPSIYQQNQAYINIKYLDPCPNVVIEALSCGLPVIYSNSGGTPELVGVKAGIGLNVDINWEYIITPKRSDILISMKKIIENYNLYSAEARNTALERFDIEYWKKKHDKIFAEILKRY